MRPLSIRVAKYLGFLFYDLGRKVVEVSSEGWRVLTDPPILFKRFPGGQIQDDPETGGSLDEFISLVNLKEATDRLLLKVFIVTSLIPDIPHPILAIHGPQGSAKSTMLRFLVRLLDPWIVEDIQNTNSMEFFQAISQRWVVPFDNLSRLSHQLSDIFCKMVTGGAFTKRRLYTNDESIIWSFIRVLILNGVALPVEKPDLLDRCLIIELNRIPNCDRMDEETLNTRFNAIKPKLLGASFDALSKAMKIYPTVELTSTPRLADFAKWGCAVAEALGSTQQEFLSAYEMAVKRQTEEALDASPMATVIRYYIEKDGELRGSPTEILRLLRFKCQAAGFHENQLPKSPHSFGKRLQEIRPNLEATGYVVDRNRGNHRTIHIYKA